MGNQGGWKWISAGLVCAVVLSSYFAAFYYMETSKYRQFYTDILTKLQKYESYMFVDVMVDYGNETRVWYNNTVVPIGATLLTATTVVAKINYTLGQWGAFVTHINDVGGDMGTYWIYNIWNSTSTSWEYGLDACDAHILQDGETFGWTYQKF